MTAVTVAVLAGIIMLQFYWLYTSYREQQSRFIADIENALAATALKVPLNDVMGNMDKNVVTQLDNTISRIRKEDMRGDGGVITINISDPDITPQEMQQIVSELRKRADSNNMLYVDESNPRILQGISAADLKTYKEAYGKELGKRAINTPFEMAVIDSAGRIAAATCDTNRFRSIQQKSSVDSLTMKLRKRSSGLQVAFPEANLFLLRKMLWILSVTLLLVLIGTVSLTSLLLLFFRQKRLADIRNDFMNNMTHELKTPISSVGVALEMVLDDRHAMPEMKRKEYLTIAQGELRRLNMLVENVLKMASFERNEIKINRESFAAEAWLQDIVHSLRPVLESRNARLQIEVQPVSLLINADKTHLTNVIQNLVENALKYNDKNIPEVTVSTWEDSAGVTIWVADNGQGIPAKYMDKIFDKFFRVPHGDRHDVKGYGLGLSYVKAIVVLHGGTISVSSTPGQGSTFTIYLPSLITN